MPSADVDIESLLAFLRGVETLKTTHRSGYTSAGTPESVAEHTWRLSLMAMLIQPSISDVDFARLVKMCLVHDLGEAIGGDVPAPEQARRTAAGDPGKSADERRDLVALVNPLPQAQRDEILGLWDEYEAAATREAQLAKALDKLETILQHTQGRNPADFDYAFNLDYGRQHTDRVPLVAAIRSLVDRETARLADAHERAPGAPTRTRSDIIATPIEPNADQHAAAWLALADDGNAPESWSTAGKAFRGAVTPERWGEQLQAVRGPLGALTSRTLAVEQRLDGLPGAPPGDYIVRQYHTVYGDVRAVVETLTLQREADGAWRVVGYFIR